MRSDDVMNTQAPQPVDERELARLKARAQLLSTFTLDELRGEAHRRRRVDSAKADLPNAMRQLAAVQDAVKALHEIIETDGMAPTDYLRLEALRR